MTHWFRSGAQAGAFAVFVMIGGCGGDDGVPAPAPSAPDDGATLPASATSSSDALIEYLGALSASDETTLPGDVRDPSPLQDETSEPVDI